MCQGGVYINVQDETSSMPNDSIGHEQHFGPHKRVYATYLGFETTIVKLWKRKIVNCLVCVTPHKCFSRAMSTCRGRLAWEVDMK